MDQAKKNHHYVWGHYLTRWSSDATKNVHFTTEKKKIAFDSVRMVAKKRDFYKRTDLDEKQIFLLRNLSRKSSAHEEQMLVLNDFLALQLRGELYKKIGVKNAEFEALFEASNCNAMENLHTAHERRAGPAIEALAAGDISFLSDATNACQFLLYLAQQMVRTDALKRAVSQGQPRRSELEIFLADTTDHAWWFYSYMLGMSLGKNLYMTRHEKTQTLLLNTSLNPFITSDQPVLNIHESVKQGDWSQPEFCDIYYPISPTHAYVLADSQRFPGGKFTINEDIVNELNIKVATRAKIHLFGTSEAVLKPLLRFIGTGYPSGRYEDPPLSAS
ncbi:DUF4238 domain-containing protein [Pseudomonas putida]|uniref:DUF4238 domain-containing protein n=1 Tax=Pseudomonas putida TaxID=303 RepID=UPI0007717005|nr:DUF4238 domain-containing protein [Pseudomonas putida]KWW13233.1 hypothetical protein AS889_16295 [Pseudomonas putida]MDQ2484062.1 DUF4238 domain-containing protein [Pseudomonas putida]